MANPTTNFGWVMPTSTSLVTNLPADFNTFGQAVDTTMAQLKGGTTGQILSKTSATDMAFTWITNDVGDITAVTAGTGLSGGGTSGAVSLAIDSTVATLTGTQTLTNKTLTSPALTTPTISTLTTNGDTIYGTGSGAISRLGIGSTGQVLTVAGGVPSWATPSSGSSFAGCAIYSSSNQTISTATATDITMNSEIFDVGGYHDTSTNTARITIPAGKAGKYSFSVNGEFGSNATGYRTIKILKNGTSTFCYTQVSAGSGFGVALAVTNIDDAAVGDYYTVNVYQNSGGNLTYFGGTDLRFSCTYLGA